MSSTNYKEFNFIKEENSEKRNYVYNKCLELRKSFKKTIIKLRLKRYEENNFDITIYNNNYIEIEFKEDKNKYLITTNSHLRKVTFILLNGKKKEHWLVDLPSLKYYLNQENIKYPTFNYNNLDISLNEDNYDTFIQSNCESIKENEKPNFNYIILMNKFIQENEDIKFSSISVSNERYFKDYYNQNKNDKIFVETPYSFFKLLNIIKTEKFEELKIIKNSKSCFSSILFLFLRNLKKVFINTCFLYIDIRFFNSNDFLSKEKTEILLREAFYAVTNEKEYDEIKEIILKFNNYSNMIPKIEKLIKFFEKQNRKIFLILDHIDLKFSAKLESFNLYLDSNKISIIKIFSLEQFDVQKIFLEEVKKKPNERNYLLMINYPQIKDLEKEYSILGKNPYYYGLIETSNKNLSFDQLYNNERNKIMDVLESFYKNNQKNLFYILSIKNIIRAKDFNYFYYKEYFENIPLDLFKIELYDEKQGIKNIEFKNYLIEYSIKNFIRKKFLSANIEPEISENLRSGNKGFLLEDLFDIFFITNELPFKNIKCVSHLIIDKLFTKSKIINNKFSLITEIDKENIFISQFNDNAKNYDSALILNLKGKKILIIFQVTENKKKKTLEKKYKIQTLKNDLNSTAINLEKLLNIKFDIIEFMFVLNLFTYKENASNIINFCHDNNINYILFDYKNFALYDKKESLINELNIDVNSIIIQRKIKDEQKMEKEEEKEEKEIESEEKPRKNKINISNIEEDDKNNNRSKNKSRNNSDNSDSEIEDLVSKKKIKENKIKISFKDDNNEKLENKTSKKKKIKSINSNKINIVTNKDESYINKKIFNKTFDIQKGIKSLHYKCNIYIFEQISIETFITIYELKNKELIHIENKQNNYLIIKKNDLFEIFIYDNEIDNFSRLNGKNIIISKNSKIVVFYYTKEKNSQIDKKKNKIFEEKGYIGNKRSYSSNKY